MQVLSVHSYTQQSRQERCVWPDVGCDAQAKVEYVLAPDTPDVPAVPADTPPSVEGKKQPVWLKRVLYVQGVSAYNVHSRECLLAFPIRTPKLQLHPDVEKQVLWKLRLNASPADILAENVHTIRVHHEGCPMKDGYRLFLHNQVCTSRSVYI